jgi:hypothetical protein
VYAWARIRYLIDRRHTSAKCAYGMGPSSGTSEMSCYMNKGVKSMTSISKTAEKNA